MLRSGAILTTIANDTVAQDGTLQVNLGAQDQQATLSADGVERVDSATARGDSVLSGGSLVLRPTAIGLDAVIGSGGVLAIYATSGGLVSGTTISAGGMVDLRALAFVSGGSAHYTAASNTLMVTEAVRQSVWHSPAVIRGELWRRWKRCRCIRSCNRSATTARSAAQRGPGVVARCHTAVSCSACPTRWRSISTIDRPASAGGRCS